MNYVRKWFGAEGKQPDDIEKELCASEIASVRSRMKEMRDYHPFNLLDDIKRIGNLIGRLGLLNYFKNDYKALLRVGYDIIYKKLSEDVIMSRPQIIISHDSDQLKDYAAEIKACE